uniref:Tetratricopeptide repeat domain 23 like n=1 Tax=Latimeria chalumnae TaxID=7897 RepID=H3AEW9_LATCH
KELIRCMTLTRLVYGDGHWRLAQSFANIAHGYLNLRDLPVQAKQHAETAKAILQTGTHLSDSEEKKEVLETILTTYYTLGMAQLMVQNKIKDAHQHLQKAEKTMEELRRLRVKKKAVLVTEKDLNIALSSRVAVLQNNLALAVMFFHKAASHVIDTQGDNAPELIHIYQDMAKAEQLRKNDRRAIEHLLQAHAIAIAQNTEINVEVAHAKLLLAKGFALLEELRYHESAEIYFTESVSAYQSALGQDNPQTINAVDEFSNWLIQVGERKRAYSLLKDVIESKLAAFGDFNENVAETYQVMYSICLAEGEMKKAYGLVKKCLHIRTVVYGSRHKKTQQTNELLVMLQ